MINYAIDITIKKNEIALYESWTSWKVVHNIF